MDMNQEQIETVLCRTSYEQQAADITDLMLNQFTIQDISTKIYEQDQQQYEQLNLSKSRLNISTHEESEQSISLRMEQYMIIQQIKQLYEDIRKMLLSIDDGTCLWKKNQKYQNYFKLFKQTIDSCKKVNIIRIYQIKSLSYLVDHGGAVPYKVYDRKYVVLGDFSVPYPQANKGKPNVQMAFKVFETQLPLLTKEKQIIQSINNIVVSKSYIQNLSPLIRQQEKLKIINSKIITISQVFPYACSVPFDDLMCLPNDHERRKFVNQFVTKQSFGTRDEVGKSFAKIKENMNVVNSIMGIFENSAAGNKNRAKEIFKCLLFKDSAHHESQVMMAEPSLDLPKDIWNLTDKKQFKPLVEIAHLPSIQFNQTIYIPRIMKQFFRQKGKIPLPQQIAILNIKEYYKNLLIRKEYKDGILLRINSPFKLKPKFQVKPTQNIPKGADKLVIHFHGSGFIGFSTYIHQAYIRNWAKNIGVPIISVEYGKAPDNPFPCAIQDCFEALIWAIHCYFQVYHAVPAKIVLAGDSSGGNLAAVLNNLLIQWNLYRLAGVVCIYPALNLNFKSFTPSLLSSLNDMILPHTFLKICLRCYLLNPELRPQEDPLLSPLLVSQQIIKQYCPMQIFIGDIDAFHDDAMRLTQKINKISPGKCHLTVFEQFPHGFIMFDMKFQAHQACGKANKMVEQAIKKLLS